ncbi:hypothetical protein HN643_03460 [Candidatus Falkowbacteria bacterium]|jgi:hypothetical protein|nr:hypothetical protein [Candidatus Falkowbacteria bacterium]MBT5503630.1 hypothetical protein [Candidatus Falkowbacteria bacterium]MBT6574094.1 hypothetical protein [Candidatus Falkowbacteria bacterium]MBT7500700.1 hypothetical protein [Candidatus Falkowbacteria bacterium]
MPNENNKIEDPFDQFDHTEVKAAPASRPEAQTQAQPVAPDPVGPNPAVKIAIIVIIVLITIGVVWFLISFIKKMKTPVVEAPVIEQVEEEVEVVPVDKVVAPVDSSIPNTPNVSDRDNDGLSDDLEKELGTNIFKADSDGDGLFDISEVNVYKTDPLTADTDGDGFLDGEEVLGGYNPKGPGKLLNFQKALTELKSSKQ